MNSRPFGMAQSPASHGHPSPDTTISSRESAQDNKDVLVQRLNVLAIRLMEEDDLDDEDIIKLHKDVDKLEQMVDVSMTRSQDNDHHYDEQSPVKEDHEEGSEDDVFWEPHRPGRNEPSREFTMQMPVSLDNNSKTVSNKSTGKAVAIAAEAEALQSQLSKTIKELHLRNEESNHIHGLLCEGLSKMAERIIYLEKEVTQLHAEFEANQSELSFLKLQMRAVEVQSLRYVPVDADRELAESIMKWKLDWARIDERTRSPLRRRFTKSIGASDDGNTTNGFV